MPIGEYGTVGPLRILKVFARELKTGDIIMSDDGTYRNLVVSHTYATAIDQQVDLDGVETDPQDPDPLQRRQYPFDKEFFIYRAGS